MMWRIWYGDGSVYSSEDGPPTRAPRHNIQAIAQPDPTPEPGNVGYVVTAGYDWYYWRTDSKEFAGAMGDGSMWDLLLDVDEPIACALQGRRIPKDRYQAILSEAQEWAEARGLPRKSGFRPDERS